MGVAVRLIDRILRARGDIHEFSQDPQCILRLQLKPAPRSVTFDKVAIKKDEPVLVLHIWNEHLPKIPSRGAELAWAIKLRRQIIQSFRGVARVMQDDARYASAKAVCGTSVLFSFTDHTGGARMMQHLGFVVLPYHRPAGRFGEFWENLFSWWLMWTYNEASLLSRRFWRLERTEVWMMADEFVQRYA